MSLRPYVSLDIETSGIDTEKSEILELGFVYDDGVSAFSQLKRHNFILKLPSLSFASFSALNMNARLIKAIHEGKDPQLAEVPYAFGVLLETLHEASAAAYKWDMDRNRKPSQRITLAGKNVASFDLPIIKSFLTRYAATEWTGPFSDSLDTLNSILGKLQHRTLDPGSMYVADFGYVPSLDEIKTFMGIKDGVSHCAVEDALDVVDAIRFKC